MEKLVGQTRVGSPERKSHTRRIRAGHSFALSLLGPLKVLSEEALGPP